MHTLYLGNRIHIEYTRFGQLKLTTHNGRAITDTMIIPKDSIKLLENFIKTLKRI